MGFLSGIGFLAPALLLGLLALPVLWWLLRATPPAAIKRRFPAVVLLLGLRDPETTPDRTPWWLLLLRMLALAALIVGFAGPILNPQEASISRKPLLILRDASWASAPTWQARTDKTIALLQDATRLGRPVAFLDLTSDLPAKPLLEFQSGSAFVSRAKAAVPAAFGPDFEALGEWFEGIGAATFDTIWLSDGLAALGKADLAVALSERGDLEVLETMGGTLALSPGFFRDGQIVVQIQRGRVQSMAPGMISAFGPDPSGVERRLAQMAFEFPADETSVEVSFDLPSELRNRVRRFAIDDVRSAGAQALSDDRLKRRKVVLIGDGGAREGQELVLPLHFLRKALAPTAELIEAPLSDSLLTNPDVVVLADVARLVPDEARALQEFVEQGGLLLRFAGPKLAAATPELQVDEPLLPVQLRVGGRAVGGAMSWGAPKKLQPFPSDSPFFGLEVPTDIDVTAQVIAEPGPLLAERTIASLQDGTPLVTQKPLGDGRVVLVHVSANAEWSSLPLSGLFVQMLERLAVSTSAAAPAASDLENQLWQPVSVLSGFGDQSPADHLLPVAGEVLAGLTAKPGLLPGLYKNDDRQVAVNVMGPDSRLEAMIWPAGVTLSDLAPSPEQPLKAYLLVGALAFLMADILATLWISGRLTGPRAGIAALLLGALINQPNLAKADDARAQAATSETVLAYVITGDAKVDAASEAGLFGLSQVLTERTAIEPANPIGVDLEADELAFYPLIYWPITPSQAIPSDLAYQKLNGFLRSGGMILFDTRDSNLGGFGSDTLNGRHLKRLAAGLDIPALEPVPRDHVLTRSFYLLQDFPGRHGRGRLWVEASASDAEQIEGVPFRNLNDGVSPVVIGGNDWASAWALSREGRYLFPIARGGFAGERQREIAYRFGVNLVMYVLTGNYKSDQVHVPALLERLGQ